MTEVSFAASDETITSAFRSGELVGIIFSYRNLHNNEFRKISARLHNTGAIDLLVLLETNEFLNVSQHSFFAGQQFYCDVIPSLNASPPAMMACVKALIKKAGADMAAGLPANAFGKWCSTDLTRSAYVIDSARDGAPDAKEFLLAALLAGSFSAEAIQFATSYDDERRLAGIVAIGRMKHEIPANAFDVLDRIATEERDDALLSAALLAAFDFVKINDLDDDRALTSLVRSISEHRSPRVLDSCANALFLHQQNSCDEIILLLTNALISLNPHQKHTIQSFDVATSELVRHGRASIGIKCIENYLHKHGDNASISDFDSFSHALRENPGELQKTLIAWMLTGEIDLCESIASLFRDAEDSPYHFDISVESLDDRDLIFISRKIIGYLFTQPTIVCSFFINALRQCSDRAKDQLISLLFDPILRSYGGKARTYLSHIRSPDSAFSAATQALAWMDEYIDQIKSVGSIQEIHPSEEARHIVRLRDFDQMRNIQKEAMEKSIFANLVTRSTILHGRRTLSYVNRGNEGAEPMEMELQSHSIEMEMPRQHIIDPVGLDYLIRSFRVERRLDETVG